MKRKLHTKKLYFKYLIESKWNQKENIYFLINRCMDITEKKILQTLRI